MLAGARILKDRMGLCNLRKNMRPICRLAERKKSSPFHIRPARMKTRSCASLRTAATLHRSSYFDKPVWRLSGPTMMPVMSLEPGGSVMTQGLDDTG
jgi:hypothetical protein